MALIQMMGMSLAEVILTKANPPFGTNISYKKRVHRFKGTLFVVRNETFEIKHSSFFKTKQTCLG